MRTLAESHFNSFIYGPYSLNSNLQSLLNCNKISNHFCSGWLLLIKSGSLTTTSSENGMKPELMIRKVLLCAQRSDQIWPIKEELCSIRIISGDSHQYWLVRSFGSWLGRFLCTYLIVRIWHLCTHLIVRNIVKWFLRVLDYGEWFFCWKIYFHKSLSNLIEYPSFFINRDEGSKKVSIWKYLQNGKKFSIQMVHNLPKSGIYYSHSF